MRKVYPFYDKTSILARNKYPSGAYGRLFLLCESVCVCGSGDDTGSALELCDGAESAAALHLRC